MRRNSHRKFPQDALFELSKIYVMADRAKRSVAEMPDRSQKVADLFGLKLYSKILWG